MPRLWNDVLWISGGLLEHDDKCSYHHIHFAFDSDGNATPRLGKVGPPITIPENQSQADIQILSKSITISHKTLRYCKAPAGNSSIQLQILKKKSNKLGHQISTWPFDKRDSGTFNRAAQFQPAIGHVLPQGFFTQKQLEVVQTSAMSAIVAKCADKTPETKIEVIHGPVSL
jgi:hypothetical protein